jgi:lipopolysaccharide/colanic/teichoic acid biosynthesis glycosyltransferase
MVINADKLGASSTSNADRRITPVGHFIRRFKIDELTQLWNVLIGDMSLVGPRPQVQSGVDLYTAKERELLLVKPGITDFASVVFSDEGTILSTSVDPDADYDRLIRPWKSRLGLVYIASRSLWLDIQLVVLTVVAIFSRAHALEGVAALLTRLNVDRDLVEVARRRDVLRPANPPGDEYMPLVPR